MFNNGQNESLGNVINIVDIELKTLREEIYELKKCQVDFVRLATIIFGLVASVVAALIRYFPKLDGSMHTMIYYFSLIFIIATIPLVFPYISWIIVHKCRSIFRIVAYIRIIEELILNQQSQFTNSYFGYETLHRKLKSHPWLTIRIVPFQRHLKMIINDFRNYKTRTKSANSNFKKWCVDNEIDYDSFDIKSKDGLIEEESTPYIGNYYGKILFFVKLLAGIGSLVIIGISLYATIIFFKTNLWISVLFVIITISVMFWSLYHHLLTKRYLMELRFKPFSIDAYYDMWRWATTMLSNEPLP